MPRKKATPTERAPDPAAASVPAPRALVGGRLSRDADAGLFGMRFAAVIPPTDTLDTWRTLDLNSQTLSQISPTKLAEYLVDISPEVSRALWEFLREVNAGREITAFTPGSNRKTPDTRARDALNAFVRQIDGLYGTVDVQINRLFLSLWLRGAICSELVLDAAGRLPVDLAIVDPAIVRAKRVDDPVRGPIFQYGQQIGGKWIPYDRPTISYIPVDPLPGSPYGRSLVAPAIFLSLFLIGLLHDLRRVIAQQGYPRYDIEIVLDEALKQMPPAAKSSPAAQEAWLTAVIRAIAADYASLEPEDAFTHTSAVKLNRPLGTLNNESLGAVPALIEAIERMCVRALKTAPFLMGLAQGSSEATANREWEAHLQGVKAIQHLVENQLGHLFTLALQAQGIVADVVVQFSENRASERQRDALTEQTQIANARAKYDHGWISQDAAAMEGAGAETADVPEPRVSAGSAEPVDAVEPDNNPDPGSARSVPANGHASLEDLMRVT